MSKAAKESYRDRVAEYRKKAKELVSRMSLTEKVAQTLHSAPAIPELGIKSYNWWNEALHGVARAGVATVFPQAIGMAAAFDEDMMEKVGEAVATEGRAKYNMQQRFDDTDIYKGLTFWAPNINIFRDPRWGRGHETLGEDPFLTSRLAVRYVRAMQGDGPYMKVAACAKHFAVHSGPEDLRHCFNAEVTEQDLYETYLPAFKACVQEAGVEAVMGAYNRTNGEPCCGSKTLLRDILRDEWGFQGHVTSDCWAIKDFHEYHKVTKGPVESVALAMNNGCDLNCGNIFVYLKDAVEQGLVEESRLDEAVENLLVTRMKLGTFEEPGRVEFDAIGYDQVDSREHQRLNEEVARKILVLLKNENGLLPLDKSSLHTIGVIGPNANNRKALIGNYEGTASRYVTVLEGIQDYVGDDVRVYYSEGCHLYKKSVQGLSCGSDRLSEVREICELSDVVIACMGLDAGLEGEEGDEGNEYASGDKPDIRLPGIQEDILKAIAESGKPVILVNLSGSAIGLDWEEQHIPAIIQGWYPGALGGRAIASMIFGDCNPEGKLPVTFYHGTEDLPEFTDYNMAGRTYRYLEKTPLYPFGYGLSYSTFAVSDVQVSGELALGGRVTVKASLTNTGAMAGAQTLQVYVKCGQEGTPNPSLKGLKKVYLEPGETARLTVELAAEDLGLFDTDGRKRLYAGDYTIYAGISQPDERSVSLMGVRPESRSLSCAKTVVVYDPKEEQRKARG